MRVRGEGLLLRAYTAADAPALESAFADPDTRRWNPPPDPLDVEAWWRRRADWSNGAHVTWAVADPADDTLLGDVSVHELDPVQGTAEIGYTVLPAARGRGVARRAVRLATDWVFAELPIVRVQLLHATGNAASCAVALAAGFVLEGTLRSSYVYGDGARHDEHVHARLATDR